ncbi:MAG: universal stress protein [Chloroflexi bacterium]|nr:universal stress protein [Chloroflexota bacterium]
MTFGNILVPVKGNPADDAAVQLACQIAKSSKARITAVNVIEIQRNQPLNVENETQMRDAEQVLEHVEQVARAARGALMTELLQARTAGVALVDEAVARGVDLIVMGIPYRKPLGDFQLGTTTQYVLKNATCPVWLCREAAPEEKS